MSNHTAALRAVQAATMRSMFEPSVREAGRLGGVQAPRAAGAVEEPGDVRLLRRRDPHDRAWAFQAIAGQGEAPAGYILAVSLWLWFTVLFANFAEAIAEGRGKAQAAALRARAATSTPRS